MPEGEQQLNLLLQLQPVCKQEQALKDSLKKLQEDKAATADQKIHLTASQQELQVRHSSNLPLLLLLSM